jgi:hypothetical protein
MSLLRTNSRFPTPCPQLVPAARTTDARSSTAPDPKDASPENSRQSLKISKNSLLIFSIPLNSAEESQSLQENN